MTFQQAKWIFQLFYEKNILFMNDSKIENIVFSRIIEKVYFVYLKKPPIVGGCYISSEYDTKSEHWYPDLNIFSLSREEVSRIFFEYKCLKI